MSKEKTVEAKALVVNCLGLIEFCAIYAGPATVFIWCGKNENPQFESALSILDEEEKKIIFVNSTSQKVLCLFRLIWSKNIYVADYRRKWAIMLLMLKRPKTMSFLDDGSNTYFLDRPDRRLTQFFLFLWALKGNKFFSIFDVQNKKTVNVSDKAVNYIGKLVKPMFSGTLIIGSAEVESKLVDEKRYLLQIARFHEAGAKIYKPHRRESPQKLLKIRGFGLEIYEDCVPTELLNLKDCAKVYTFGTSPQPLLRRLYPNTVFVGPDDTYREILDARRTAVLGRL